MNCTIGVGQEETEFSGYLHSLTVVNLRAGHSLLETLRPSQKYQKNLNFSSEPVYIMRSNLTQENTNQQHLLELSYHGT